MNYTRISADCHIDMPWIPPTSSPPTRRRPCGTACPTWSTAPTVRSGPARTGRRSGWWAAWARAAPSWCRARTTGSTRWPRPASTRTARRASGARPIPHLRIKDMERDGVQAEVIFGILGAATRLERPRGRQGDVPHLQRLAEGLLPALPRPADRPGLPALRRHRRRREGSPPRGQDGHPRPRAVVLVGHGPDVAPRVGAAVEGRQRGRTCRCTSTRSRARRRPRATGRPGSPSGPPSSSASPASR